MRCYTARIYKQVETGRNKLGTPIVKEAEYAWCIVRPAPASPDLKEIEGNSMHTLTRTWLTQKPAIEFKGACAFEVRGQKYRLIDVSATDNGTLITGTCAKQVIPNENENSA